jgi:hypothetical protein
MQKSNSSRPIWIVFDRRNFGGYVEFVPLKIDLPVVLSVTATPMSNCNPAFIVPAVSPSLRLKK